MDQAPVIYSIDQAPFHILLHLAAALAALAVGAVVLWRRKGTASHRLLGRVWAGLMLVVAVGSFFIQAHGRFSLLHVLSVVVIVCMIYAVYAIRHNNLRAHQRSMRFSYMGLCIAGVFTLLPYRMLGRLVFG
jgi:uncharacterized membrane protein